MRKTDTEWPHLNEGIERNEKHQKIIKKDIGGYFVSGNNFSIVTAYAYSNFSG